MTDGSRAAATQIHTPVMLSPTWQRRAGPLSVLPISLFQDRRPWRAILVGWVLTITGSTILSFVIAHLVPGGAGPDLGGTSTPMTLFLIAVFSPVVETIVMIGILAILLRVLAGWQAVIVSAILWGIAHSLASPLWGAVIWWPFLIFSTLYVTWRPHGFWKAAGIVAAVHVLQNLFPALLIVMGR